MIGSSAMRWLLGLESVPADATDVRLAWDRPFPTWVAVAVVAVAIAAAWASYRSIDIAPGRRRTLVALRSAAIVLLAALLAGPLLEVPRESIEPDSVIVLADRSRSMEVEDVTSRTGGTRTRDAALREIVGPGTPFADAGDEHRIAVGPHPVDRFTQHGHGRVQRYFHRRPLGGARGLRGSRAGLALGDIELGLARRLGRRDAAPRR